MIVTIDKSVLKKTLEVLFKENDPQIKNHKSTIDGIVNAESAGKHSHGLLLLPGILQAIKEKRIIPSNKPKITLRKKNYLLIDGNNSFGIETGLFATKKAVQVCKKFDFCIIGIKNMNHWGRAGQYCKIISEENMSSFALVSTSPIMLISGKEKIGNNVMACAFPVKSAPLVLDFSTSIISMGRVQELYIQDEKYATDLGIDINGVPTNNPEEILNKGTLYPASGFKGIGIALIIEIIVRMFTGKTVNQLANNFPLQARGSTTVDSAVIIAFNNEIIPVENDYKYYVDSLRENIYTENMSFLPGDHSRYVEASNYNTINVSTKIIEYLRDKEINIL